MLDVFTVFFPKKNANGQVTVDLEKENGKVKEFSLLEDYDKVTLDQVAASCEWMWTCLDHTQQSWIPQNLRWSAICI